MYNLLQGAGEQGEDGGVEEEREREGGRDGRRGEREREGGGGEDGRRGRDGRGGRENEIDGEIGRASCRERV